MITKTIQSVCGWLADALDPCRSMFISLNLWREDVRCRFMYALWPQTCLVPVVMQLQHRSNRLK